MARSKSSARWLREHFDDVYVKQAQAEGWRSRAVYKLAELVDRDHLLHPGMVVVDLGSAPGGWSQWVHQRLGDRVRMLALDILPMQGIDGVDFIVGDFREDAVLAALETHLAGQMVDLVLSDMAPNMTGVTTVDQARAMHLAELALDFAQHWLKPGGAFVVKLFRGAGFDDYVVALRKGFGRVTLRKPKASRPRSSEIYAVASARR